MAGGSLHPVFPFTVLSLLQRDITQDTVEISSLVLLCWSLKMR